MNATVPPAAPELSPSKGLAIAALILGIFSIVLSPVLLGAVLGLIGLVLGAMHLSKSGVPKAMAGWGLALSLAGILASGLFGYAWYRGYNYVKDQIEAGGGSGSADSSFASWIGQPAPEIEVTTLDGNTVKLSDMKGRRVVIDFWATWCPPCRMEIPHFIDIASDDNIQDVFVLGISDEDEGTLKKFAEKNKMNYAVASAEAEVEPYTLITGIPTTFFIDREGIIRNVIVGYHDLDGLKEEIAKLDAPGQ